MAPAFDSDIRNQIAASLGATVRAEAVRLPARQADASLHLPRELQPEAVLSVDFGSLYGTPLVAETRIVNGWLLFRFSDSFFSALVGRVNAALALPEDDGESHARNRMRALARHGGEGCPPVLSMQRALLLSVSAYRSEAALQKAEAAAESLFHSIPPRERAALLSVSGALGGALARLLSLARDSRSSLPVRPL